MKIWKKTSMNVGYTVFDAWSLHQKSYILKARILTPTIPQFFFNFPQICPKMPQNGPKITQSGPKWPKMAQNWSKWPKNDARIYALFPQFFFDWKGSSANFFAFRMYGGAEWKWKTLCYDLSLKILQQRFIVSDDHNVEWEQDWWCLGASAGHWEAKMFIEADRSR